MSNDKKENYRSLISKYQNQLWIPKYTSENIFEQLNESKPYAYKRTKQQIPKIENNNIRIYRVNVFPDKDQKAKILNLMNLATRMYNETVSLLSILRKNSLESDLEEDKEKYEKALKFEYTRTTLLIDFRNKLNKEGGSDIHILDAAIKHACTEFKSAETNKARNNIKDFKVRFQKSRRNNRVIEIDKDRFNSSTLLPNILGKGELKCELEGGVPIHFSNIASTCFLRYSKDKNRFQLIVNQKCTEKDNIKRSKIKLGSKLMKELDKFDPEVKSNSKNFNSCKRFDYFPSNHKIYLKNETEQDTDYEFSSLDPGLRTFMTCLTNKDCKEYGKESFDKVKKMLIKINNARNQEDITVRKFNKFKRRIYKRIKNIVDDLHWKTINDLSKKSEEIILGNMSSRSLVSRRNKTLDCFDKQAVLRMRYYAFRKRLEDKCQLRDKSFIFVDESYTSKICSVCGNEHRTLGSNRVFECSKCKLVIQRDLNACRGIWIKSMDKTNFK